jgi:hypothetical protein
MYGLVRVGRIDTGHHMTVSIVGALRSFFEHGIRMHAN